MKKKEKDENSNLKVKDQDLGVFRGVKGKDIRRLKDNLEWQLDSSKKKKINLKKIRHKQKGEKGEGKLGNNIFWFCMRCLCWYFCSLLLAVIYKRNRL